MMHYVAAVWMDRDDLTILDMPLSPVVPSV